MKKRINQLLGMGLCLCLCFSLAVCGQTLVQASSTEAVTEAATETAADDYLASLQGTYEELFPAMNLDENKEIWYQNFKDVLGVEDEEDAETLRELIIGMFSADVYGQEAVDLAAETPDYGLFDCYFINGISTLKFEGNTITGYDADGNEVFSHNYTKVDDVKTDYGAMNETYSAYFTDETWPTMAVYESDGDDDDFKYFAFCGDSPEETFHIEFRYGATLDNLTSYYDGDYAYWLAAGFLQDAPDGMMENCINLFVTENADSFAAYLEPESTEN